MIYLFLFQGQSYYFTIFKKLKRQKILLIINFKFLDLYCNQVVLMCLKKLETKTLNTPVNYLMTNVSSEKI